MDQSVIIYVIEITKREEKWSVEKRYSEFDELNKTLKKTYANIPSMPGKSFFKISEPDQIEERRKGLEVYLKVGARFRPLQPIWTTSKDTLCTPRRDLRWSLYLMFLCLANASALQQVEGADSALSLPWKLSIPLPFFFWPEERFRILIFVSKGTDCTRMLTKLKSTPHVIHFEAVAWEIRYF